MSDEIIGYRYIKKRSTGERMGPLAPILKKDWPLKLPPPSQIVWRYMDLWKFEAMVRTSSLYFRRADNFQTAEKDGFRSMEFGERRRVIRHSRLPIKLQTTTRIMLRHTRSREGACS